MRGLALATAVLLLSGCLGGASRSVTQETFTAGMQGQGGAKGGNGVERDFEPALGTSDAAAGSGWPEDPEPSPDTSSDTTTDGATSETETTTSDSTTDSTTSDSTTDSTTSETTTSETTSEETTTETTEETTPPPPPPPPANNPPEASLTADSTAGSAPLAVTFTMHAVDPDGDAVDWWFDANNDTFPEAAGQDDDLPRDFTAFYPVPGTYVAAFHVSDGMDETVESILITVS